MNPMDAHKALKILKDRKDSFGLQHTPLPSRGHQPVGNRRPKYTNESTYGISGSAIIPDGKHRLPKMLLRAEGDIMCLAFIPFGEIVAGGLSNGKTFLYSIAKAGIVRTLEESGEHRKKNMAVTSVQTLAYRKDKGYPFSNSEVLLTANVTGCLQVWNWRKKTLLHTINESNAIHGVAVGQDKLISVGKNSSIIMYDLNTFQKEREYIRTTQRDIVTGHTSRVFTARFHPIDENEFVTGGWDNMVLFWDRRQSQPIRSIFGPHICGDSIDISADGEKLLTCAWSEIDSVQVWSYRTGKRITTVTEDPVAPKNYAGKWATKEIAICGGTSPNALRVISPYENAVKGGYSNLPGGVYAIQCCHTKDSWLIQQKPAIPKATTSKNANDSEQNLHLPTVAFCCGPYLYYASNR